ncbi:MAG: uncharacterized protein QOD92_3125 [Acidimicrobiaceae bacterium]|jgi:HD superfamily phosphohydrolase
MAALEFRVGDAFDDYVIQDRDPGSGGTIARPLGSGGAGQVYRVLYKETLVRAAKFLQPAKVGSGGEQAFVRTFAREKALLAHLTHTNMAKLLDFGAITQDDKDYPYIVTDFVAGQEIDKVWAHPISGVAFLDLLDGVFAAVEYLHDQGVLHADLKDKNILCSPDASGGFVPYVLDVGVAKVVADSDGFEVRDADDQEDLFSAERTRFYSTERICPPKWVARLGNEVTHDQLLEMFPTYDLFALGKLLEGALGDADLVLRLGHDLHAQAVEAVGLIRDRLLASPDDAYYEDVSQLREDWAKLRPLYLAPVGIPELALSAQFHHSVATWRGRVVVTDRLHEVINHDVFQRLRDIPQLELLARLYPGATHTRMVHALTTLDISREYVAQLLNDHRFRLSVSRPDLEAILLLALLHDLGHFPLSHMFEDFSEEQSAYKPAEERIPTDDDLFWTFFDPADDDRNTEYPSLKATLLDRISPLRQVVEEQFDAGTVDAMRGIHGVLRRFDAHPRASHCILAGVISSAIDADKVAYLLDDSQATGVSYGRGVDLEGLLGALAMPPADMIDARPAIAILDKGLSAAESIATARYAMLRRVYWHHTNRAMMAMVKWVVSQLLRADRFNMDAYLARVCFSNVGDALDYLSGLFDEAVDAGALASDGSSQPRNTMLGLRSARRELHRRIVEVPYGPDDEDRHLYRVLSGKRWRDILELEERRAEVLSHDVPSIGKLRAGDVLVDLPVKEREGVSGKDGGETWVYAAGRGQRAVKLAEASPIIKSLGDEFDYHVKKCRVFLHPEALGALSVEERAQVSEVARAVLSDSAQQ